MVAPCNQQYPITSSSKYDDEDLPGIGSWSQVRQVRVGAVAKYEVDADAMYEYEPFTNQEVGNQNTPTDRSTVVRTVAAFSNLKYKHVQN